MSKTFFIKIRHYGTQFLREIENVTIAIIVFMFHARFLLRSSAIIITYKLFVRQISFCVCKKGLEADAGNKWLDPQEISGKREEK